MFLFPTPAATELAGVAADTSPALPLLRHRRFVSMSSFCFIVFVTKDLLTTTATPAPSISAVSPAHLFLGAAPICPSGNNRSTHPECRLTRSVRVCISKAPPPLHAASDPFIYVESPICCSSASSDSAEYPRRIDSDSSPTVANRRRYGQGGGSLLCKIKSSTARSPDITSLVNDTSVPAIEATPAHQDLYGDKLYGVEFCFSNNNSSASPSPTQERNPFQEDQHHVFPPLMLTQLLQSDSLDARTPYMNEVDAWVFSCESITSHTTAAVIPIINCCISSTVVLFHACLGPVMYTVFVTARAHQNRDNLSRENLVKSPAQQRLHPSPCPQRSYPEVCKTYLSTRFTSLIGRRVAEPFSENGFSESLKHKTLVCNILGKLWVWTWLQLLGYNYTLRGSKAIRYLKFQSPGSIRQPPPTLPASMLDFNAKFINGVGEEKSFNRLTILLTDLLLTGTFEIHLVSRDILDGCRADLFLLMGNIVSIGFPSLFQPLSLGYLNVFSDYLKLSRAVVSRIQVKNICGSLYFELASPSTLLSLVLLLCCLCFLSYRRAYLRL